MLYFDQDYYDPTDEELLSDYDDDYPDEEYDGQPDDYTELSDFEQADEYFTGWAVPEDDYF